MAKPEVQRTTGGIIRVGGRHLGRARRYRKRNKNTTLNQSRQAQEAIFWEPCNICGGNFNYAACPENVFMSKHYCGWCAGRDPKRQIQYMVLVEKMAEQIKCLKPAGRIPFGDKEREKWEKERENCKCLSCTARRVVRRDTARFSS